MLGSGSHSHTFTLSFARALAKRVYLLVLLRRVTSAVKRLVTYESLINRALTLRFFLIDG